MTARTTPADHWTAPLRTTRPAAGKQIVAAGTIQAGSFTWKLPT